MRELTEYEKKKWIGKFGVFESPEHLHSNDEWGEMMDSLRALCEMGTDYGLSDEFEKLCQVEYLDHYYDQIYYIYLGEWGYDTPEEHGLPPIEEVKRRQDRAMELGVEKLTAVRMALDWAMKWRDDHLVETFKKQRKEALEKELAALGE